LLITGYDILFFWVARMIMLGIHFTGEVPFRTVYLHSLVRTASGEKMSKSKGTGLDPVKLNQQYGTDAMRFCLASMAAPGTDIILSDDRLASARNFANKIWNASRFLFVNLDKFEQSGGATFEQLAAPDVRRNAPYDYKGSIPLIDEWIFEKLAAARTTVNTALVNYRFHEAAQTVYQFFWGDFCDWYIEWIKPDLLNSDRERACVAWRNLFAAFDGALRLLHPFMPFITEELWHQLPQRPGDKSIALQSFAPEQKDPGDQSRVNEFALVQDVIAELRNIRAEMKLDAKKKVSAEFYSSYEYVRSTIQRNLNGLLRLASLSDMTVSANRLAATGGAVRSTAKFDVRIAYATEAIDISGEIARLRKEIDGLQKAIASKERQLDDASFRKRAPEKIVRGMEATLAEQKLELQKLLARLSQLDRAA
jgi:valyl-tRNA synthetase